MRDESMAIRPLSFRQRRKAFRLQPSSLILALIVAVVLLYGVVYPNLRVFLSSLQVDNRWSLANFSELLSQRAVLDAALSSILLSLVTVITCALLGVSLAFLFERYTFPARRIFAALAALPL